jgi:hypothetical protein
MMENLNTKDILITMRAVELKRFVNYLHLKGRINNYWKMKKLNIIEELSQFLELEEYTEENIKKYKLKKKPSNIEIYIE